MNSASIETVLVTIQLFTSNTLKLVIIASLNDAQDLRVSYDWFVGASIKCDRPGSISGSPH